MPSLRTILRSSPASVVISLVSVLLFEILVRPHVDNSNWSKYYFGLWMLVTYWCATKHWAAGLTCSLVWWGLARWILHPDTFDLREELRETERLTIQVVAPLLVSYLTQRRRAAERKAMETEHQRVEMLRQLALAFSHEGNNMLMIIIGNLDLLTNEDGENPRLRAIRGAANRLADRFKQFRQHAKQNEIPPELVEMAREIDSIAGVRE